MDPDRFINELYQWLERKIRRRNVSYSDLKHHWKSSIPILFSLAQINEQYQLQFDEIKIKKVLMDPFILLLCNGNRAISRNALAFLEGPSVMCQAILRPQELAFTCMDCASDSSLQMCAACFLETDHRRHAYEISLRRTRGFCQCGNTDAWSENHTCGHHGSNAFNTEEFESLCEGLRPRAEEVFLWITKYAIKVLKMDEDSALSNDLFGVPSPGDEMEHCIVIQSDVVNQSLTDILMSALNVSHAQVNAISRTIRRYGRAVVERGTPEHCAHLKLILQSLLDPDVKVIVLLNNVLSHQIYAMRILDWIHNLITRITGLREVYAEVVMNHSSNGIVLMEDFIINEFKFSRETRTIIHLLIRATIYTSNVRKAQFGTLVIKHYNNMVKNFTRADRDYSVGIAQISSEVFALPELAGYFILSCGALVALVNMLLSEWSQERNELEILIISSSTTKHIIRQQYVVNDIILLLKSKSLDWSDRYQEQILHCLPALVNLLGIMQRNEMTRRITGTRESDTDWEPSFWMQMRFTTVIKFVTDWCSSNRTVFILAYRSALQRLLQDSRFNSNWLVFEVDGYRARVLRYRSILDHVSLSLPLSRFLTGLYLLLEKYNLRFTSPELSTGQHNIPEQILEPVLRMWAVIGQSAAGLWLYNSDTFHFRLSIYYDVLCRAEMLDKDLLLLQICATLIPCNGFLINIIYKFDLMNWMTEPLENESPDLHTDLVRNRIRLIEELLDFLIMVTGGRFHPEVGQVTEDECVRKEIIQQLCIQPMTPAQLKDAISNNGDLDEEVERLVREVADCKREVLGKTPAVYELKSSFMDEFNLFHHHYMRHQISEAEENQLMLRRRAGMPHMCPPPPLPLFRNKFRLVAALLHCDTMLSLLQRVLLRCSQMGAQVHSLLQLQKALHLIGYALHDQERDPLGNSSFTTKAERLGLGRILVTLSTFERAAPHKELIKWAVEKYRSLAGENSDIASALSNISEPVVNEDQRRASRKRRHEEIMAQMKEKQRKFLAANAQAFAAMDAADAPASEPVAGPSTAPDPVPPRRYSCILCQEEQSLADKEHPLVMPASMQLSMVLLRGSSEDLELYPPALPTPHVPWLHSALAPAPYVSSCGHIMHAQCLQTYISQEKEPQPFDEPRVNRCPMCNRVFSASMPLLPPLGTPQSPFTMRCTMDLDTWIQGLLIVVQGDHTRDPSAPQQHSGPQTRLPIAVTDVCPVSNLYPQMSAPVVGATQVAYTNQNPQHPPSYENSPSNILATTSTHSHAQSLWSPTQNTNMPVESQLPHASMISQSILNTAGSITPHVPITLQSLPPTIDGQNSHECIVGNIVHPPSTPETSNLSCTLQITQKHGRVAREVQYSIGPQVTNPSLVSQTSQVKVSTQPSNVALTSQSSHSYYSSSDYQQSYPSQDALNNLVPHISHVAMSQQAPHTSNIAMAQKAPHSSNTAPTEQAPHTSNAPVAQQAPQTSNADMAQQAPRTSNAALAQQIHHLNAAIAQQVSHTSHSDLPHQDLQISEHEQQNIQQHNQAPHNANADLSHHAYYNYHATLPHQSPHISQTASTHPSPQISHTSLPSHADVIQQSPHAYHPSFPYQAPHISNATSAHPAPHIAHAATAHQAPPVSHTALVHQSPHISHTALAHQTPLIGQTTLNHQIPHISNIVFTNQTSHIFHIASTHLGPPISRIVLAQQTQPTPHIFDIVVTHQNSHISHNAVTHQTLHISHNSSTHQIPHLPHITVSHPSPHIHHTSSTLPTPHISHTASPDLTQPISHTALALQSPHISHIALANQAPHISHTVLTQQTPHIAHTAITHILPHVTHTALTQNSNAAMAHLSSPTSSLAMSQQALHTSNDAMSQQAANTPNDTIAQQAPHISIAAMAQQTPHSANVALDEQIPQTSNTAMAQQIQHATNCAMPEIPTSNAAMSQQASHTCNSAIGRRTPHTSNDTMAEQSLRTPSTVLAQQTPHSSNATTGQPAPPSSNAAMGQPATPSSNADMAQPAARSSNADLAQLAAHSSNAGMVERAPHSSNADMAEPAPHTSNAAMGPPAPHSSNAAMVQPAPHSSNAAIGQPATPSSNADITLSASHSSNADMAQTVPHSSTTARVQQTPHLSNDAVAQQDPHHPNPAMAQPTPNTSHPALDHEALQTSHNEHQNIERHNQISEEARNFVNSMGLASNVNPSVSNRSARVGHCMRQHSLRQSNWIMGEDGRAFERAFVTVGTRSVDTYIPAGVQRLVRDFTQSVNSTGRGGPEHAVLTSWKSAAYTIHALESRLRDGSQPLLGQLLTFQLEYFEFFTQLSGVVGNVMLHPLELARYAYELITMVIQCPHSGPCLFDWDTFGTVVSLSFALPNLFGSQSTPKIPTGIDRNIIHMLLCAQIVKAVLSYKIPDIDENDNDEGSDSRHSGDSKEDYHWNPSFPPLLQIMQIAHDSVELPIVYDNLLVSHVHETCIPFLRCCCLFYHFITKESAPQELLRRGGDTFENLCKFLNLPSTIEAIMKSNEVPKLIRLWLNHPKVKFIVNNPSQNALIHMSQKVRTFKDLPFEYSTLLSLPELFSCENSEQDFVRNLLICLICSEKLCSSSTCCEKDLNGTKVGACIYHTYKCGAGVGMFLRVRESDVVLLVASDRGCFLPGPYVDKNGETDDSLRRGKPLMLCPVRMRGLFEIWLNHEIYDIIDRMTDEETLDVTWQNL